MKENKTIYGYITGAAANNDGVNIHQMDKMAIAYIKRWTKLSEIKKSHTLTVWR